MPARKVGTALQKANEENKKTSRTVTKPIISVTEKSSPDKILQSSWLFLTTFQFFSIFQNYFELPTLDIEELEQALIQPDTSALLETVIVRILAPLLSRRSVNRENYEKRLQDLFPDVAPFHTLSVVDKIKLLKRIEEANLETEDFLSWKNEVNVDELRLSPLGKDNEGWSYWYFGGNRLYRETPIPSGKKGMQTLKNNQFTFELVCSSLEEWEKIMNRFQPSKKIAPRELSEKIIEIAEKIIGRIKAKEIAKVKQEAKLKRAKELELIPKKRSRRLEVKFEEEAKRQKIEEIANQQAILEEIERRKQEQEIKKLKEEEKQKLKTEDARLRIQVSDYVKKKLSEASEEEERVELKQLKNQLHKDASEIDKITKMKGWLRLLREEILVDLVDQKDGHILFDGDDKALDHNLFKMILRTFLVFDDEEEQELKEIYRKLLLNRGEDFIFENPAVSHQLGVDRNDMVAPDVSRVLVIYTGGTIGMKHTPEHGYIPLPNYLAESLSKVQRFHDPQSSSSINRPGLSRCSSSESLDSLSESKSKEFGAITNTVKAVEQDGQIKTFQLPSLITPVSLFGKRIRYSILEYTPLLDSCDITMADWVRIADDIQANYQLYDAFIVLHGTDTMAYTASALSFMMEELGKTVIITGSQVPLTEVRNDAVENLLGALTIAGHFVIPEVTLYFGKKLYRGNRTSKISAVDFEAFDSPNLSALVNVGINIDVNWPLVLRPTHIARFHVNTELNPNVGSLRLFPGISDSTIRAFLAPPLQGVVLETFGAGNAPCRPDLLKALKEASDRGVVIVNCTQCRKGLVTDAYATGKQLASAGVVPGADMTAECALTKLAYLLGKSPNNPDYVRRMMTKNLRGELTVRTPYQRFSASTNRTNLLVNILMKFAARSKVAVRKELEDEDQDLTMSVEEEMLAQKALGPVLLCSAAGSNDLEGLRLLVESMEEMINLNCVDYDGRIPLHVACREGHFRIVEYLLLHGSSIHLRDRSGHTPLFDAVLEKHADVVALLREAGAHLAESEINDMGPIWFKAIKTNNLKWVQVALNAGFDVNWCDPIEGRHGLDIAVCLGRLSMFKVLLSHPTVNVKSVDNWGMSILDKIELLKKKSNLDVDTSKKISIQTLEEMEILIKNKSN
ncbi:hypothetical protein G6F51_001342 [Rhizopus arrhizus]|uniref:asparaginase n=1 Tax=Rhizopus oryzae TaxID=64495 RepID=A0A9P6YM89_RHIOR|nr:hypothetical protein G6F51_001342 [Rhizopus arrhizus]